MAGSVTISKNEYFARQRSVICKCTSDASGDVSGTGFQVQGGNLYGITFFPVSGCSDLWDLTATMDKKLDDGTTLQLADVLDGQGANLSNSTNGDHVVLSEPFPLIPNSIITPIIANLGNAQTVYIAFDIWEEVGV